MQEEETLVDTKRAKRPKTTSVETEEKDSADLHDRVPEESGSETPFSEEKKKAPVVKKGKRKGSVNAYIVFCMEECKKEEYKGILMTERTRKISSVWNSMTDDDKKLFREKAKRLKEERKEESASEQI